MKASRYYKIVNDMVYVYDSPFPDNAQSVSIVPISDLTYYRRNFELSKVWKVEP